jgi:hypothetical protein
VSGLDVLAAEPGISRFLIRMAELFGVDVRTVSYHLKAIYFSGELTPEATLQRIWKVQREGTRDVRREIEFYNLDAIISVGYRVNSAQATQFRIWATQTLREFIVKGFVLDDERLKLNKRFGKDYFGGEVAAPAKLAQRIVEGGDPLESMATEVEPLPPSTDR